MENRLPELTDALLNAVSKCIEGADEVGIPFSGGLDSSLIALLAKKCAKKANITLYTVGTIDSYDLSNVEQASKLLGMSSKSIVIHTEDITGAMPKLARIIDTTHPVKLTFELPLFLGLANIDEKLIISGQGADELFGGYARYLKMEKESLRRALTEDVNTLIANDIKMDYKLAEHFNKTLKTPYLDDDVVSIASKIPVEHKVNNGRRKIILREVGLQLGLPLELVNKEKRASQYSSGILKALRRTAKEKSMGVNELIEHLLQGSP